MPPDVLRLTGDAGRLLLACLLEVRNGFVKSAALLFVGDVFAAKLFNDGVNGAFVSERERCRPGRAGVFGLYDMCSYGSR